MPGSAAFCCAASRPFGARPTTAGRYGQSCLHPLTAAQQAGQPQHAGRSFTCGRTSPETISSKTRLLFRTIIRVPGDVPVLPVAWILPRIPLVPIRRVEVAAGRSRPEAIDGHSIWVVLRL